MLQYFDKILTNTDSKEDRGKQFHIRIQLNVFFT